MRMMLAVGHLNRTRTKIVVAGRGRDDWHMEAAKAGAEVDDAQQSPREKDRSAIASPHTRH